MEVYTYTVTDSRGFTASLKFDITVEGDFTAIFYAPSPARIPENDGESEFVLKLVNIPQPGPGTGYLCLRLEAAAGNANTAYSRTDWIRPDGLSFYRGSISQPFHNRAWVTTGKTFCIINRGYSPLTVNSPSRPRTTTFTRTTRKRG